MMKGSRSEPIIKGTRYNIGNGYGQYCVLDEPNFKPKISPRNSDKIRLNVISSDNESSDTELSKPDKKNVGETFRNKIFVAGVYVTTLVIIAFEYWYCFKQ
jgi:hypothetical protein